MSDYESLKLAAEKMIKSGSWVGLNPHKVKRLCIEYEQLRTTNRKLHRRTQEAEAASIEWRKFSELTKEQSTGRFFPALMRKALSDAHEENERLRAASRPELSETPVIDGQQATAPMADELSVPTRRRVVTSLGRLIADARHREDDCRGNLDNGSQGGYSENLTKDIKLLDELEEGIEATDGDALTAAYSQGFEDAKKVILQTVQEIGEHI
ncbi:MAG: hypothetical protein ACYS1A_17425 [Planctomycetota bacterium]|jgi:hypothetical protein